MTTTTKQFKNLTAHQRINLKTSYKATFYYLAAMKVFKIKGIDLV